MRTSERLLGVPRESRGIKVKRKRKYPLLVFRSDQWRVFFLWVEPRTLKGEKVCLIDIDKPPEQVGIIYIPLEVCKYD